MRFASATLTLFVLAIAARAGDVEIDGLKSKTPDNWKTGKTTTPMQKAVFALPKADGDPEDATLTVFFFGAGQGGSLDANVKRWKDLFKTPAGENAKVEKLRVGDVDVTTVDVSGTYLFRIRPGDENVTEKPNFRLVGVYFGSKNGPYYMRFVGPAKTMEKHMKDFNDWLKNFK
jgi:hypothetical protein